MLDAIISFLKGRVGESRLMRWGLACASVLAVIGLYKFFIDQSSASFDKYYEYKLAKCARAVITVAQIANSTDEKILREAIQHFDELYYGELVLFESYSLEKEMVDFREVLGEPNKGRDQSLEYDAVRTKRDGSPDKFRQAALRLSKICRYEITPSPIKAMIDRVTPTHK